MDGQIRPPREVLPKKSVRIFVGAALPGASRITEIHLSVRRQGEGLVVREFHAAIPGQGLTELVWPLPDVRAKGRHHGLGVLARDFHQHRKPGVPLDERREVGIATSGNEVAFPMTRDGSVFDLRSAIGNGNPIDNLPTPQSPDIAVSRLAKHALSPEMLLQLFFQPPPASG